MFTAATAFWLSSEEEPIQPLEPTLTVTPDSPMSSPLSAPSLFRVSVAHL